MATFEQSAGAGCLGGLPIRWGQSGTVATETPITEIFAEALANGPGIALSSIINSNPTLGLASLIMSGDATGIVQNIHNNGTSAFGYITLGDQATLGVAGSFNFGEIIFQWGTQTNNSGYQSDASYPVPFGTAFPNNCWWAVVFPTLISGSIDPQYAWPYVNTYTPAGITVIPSLTNTGEYFTEIGYFAIGN